MHQAWSHIANGLLDKSAWNRMSEYFRECKRATVMHDAHVGFVLNILIGLTGKCEG